MFYAPESLTLLTEIYLSLTSFLMSPEGSRNSFRLDQDVPAEKLLPGFNQTSDRRITTYIVQKYFKFRILQDNSDAIVLFCEFVIILISCDSYFFKFNFNNRMYFTWKLKSCMRCIKVMSQDWYCIQWIAMPYPRVGTACNKLQCDISISTLWRSLFMLQIYRPQTLYLESNNKIIFL